MYAQEQSAVTVIKHLLQEWLQEHSELKQKAIEHQFTKNLLENDRGKNASHLFTQDILRFVRGNGNSIEKAFKIIQPAIEWRVNISEQIPPIETMKGTMDMLDMDMLGYDIRYDSTIRRFLEVNCTIEPSLRSYVIFKPNRTAVLFYNTNRVAS